MLNPYEILNLNQDANKNEILAAQKNAMLLKKYPLNEIAIAASKLLNPSKRLAADFMYPAKIPAKRPKRIETDIVVTEVNLSTINSDAFCSLKNL